MNIEKNNLLPVITSENDVYPYLKKINQFPILSDEEEKTSVDWIKNGDIKAAQKLVTSHLRLGMQKLLWAQGLWFTNVILILRVIWDFQAIRKFDPEKVLDLRLMQLVGLGINPRICFTQFIASKNRNYSSTKKLFFNLRRLRNNQEI